MPIRGASFLLPHRLAPTLRRDPLPPGAGPVRGMRPSAPAAGLPSRGWPVVGCRDLGLARRSGPRLRRLLRDENLLARIRITKVVLAAAHRDHDTANNEDANLAAFCQRCHMLHDRDEHQRRRWCTMFGARPWATCSRGRTRPPKLKSWLPSRRGGSAPDRFC